MLTTGGVMVRVRASKTTQAEGVGDSASEGQHRQLHVHAETSLAWNEAAAGQ